MGVPPPFGGKLPQTAPPWIRHCIRLHGNIGIQSKKEMSGSLFELTNIYVKHSPAMVTDKL